MRNNYNDFINNDFIKLILLNCSFNIINDNGTIEFSIDNKIYTLKRIYRTYVLFHYTENNTEKYITYAEMIELYSLINLYYNLKKGNL